MFIREDVKTQGEFNMAEVGIDTSTIEGYADMSAEFILLCLGLIVNRNV